MRRYVENWQGLRGDFKDGRLGYSEQLEGGSVGDADDTDDASDWAKWLAGEKYDMLRKQSRRYDDRYYLLT